MSTERIREAVQEGVQVLAEPEMHTFVSGAMRSEIKPRYDLIPSIAIRRLAQRYGLGAEKYGPYNWQKGLPLDDTFNHLMDHLENMKPVFQELAKCSDKTQAREFIRIYKEALADGRRDDDLGGAMWGIAALMYFIDLEMV